MAHSLGSGLANLRGLDGVFGLSFFWHTSRLRGDDLQCLDGLIQSWLSRLPGRIMRRPRDATHCCDSNLRMLMGQGTVATDEGFRSLSRSQTIEYIWGRECPNLKGQGFVAWRVCEL